MPISHNQLHNLQAPMGPHIQKWLGVSKEPWNNPAQGPCELRRCDGPGGQDLPDSTPDGVSVTLVQFREMARKMVFLQKSPRSGGEAQMHKERLLWSCYWRAAGLQYKRQVKRNHECCMSLPPPTRKCSTSLHLFTPHPKARMRFDGVSVLGLQLKVRRQWQVESPLKQKFHWPLLESTDLL